MTATAQHGEDLKQYVAYLRVSTQMQGDSGLGLKAQEITINNWVNDKGGILVHSFTEIESGKKTNRIQLEKAIKRAKEINACLVVSKLDRLGRKINHLFEIRDSGIDIAICDMPQLNTLTFGIYSTLAQHERELISKRTSDALQAKGYQGQPQNFTISGRLSGAKSMKAKKQANPNNQKAKKLVQLLMAQGASKKECVKQLNENGFVTSTGRAFTSNIQIIRLLQI